MGQILLLHCALHSKSEFVRTVELSCQLPGRSVGLSAILNFKFLHFSYNVFIFKICVTFSNFDLMKNQNLKFYYFKFINI